jgi:hypothetical protein
MEIEAYVHGPGLAKKALTTAEESALLSAACAHLAGLSAAGPPDGVPSAARALCAALSAPQPAAPRWRLVTACAAAFELCAPLRGALCREAPAFAALCSGGGSGAGALPPPQRSVLLRLLHRWAARCNGVQRAPLIAALLALVKRGAPAEPPPLEDSALPGAAEIAAAAAAAAEAGRPRERPRKRARGELAGGALVDVATAAAAALREAQELRAALLDAAAPGGLLAAAAGLARHATDLADQLEAAHDGAGPPHSPPGVGAPPPPRAPEDDGDCSFQWGSSGSEAGSGCGGGAQGGTGEGGEEWEDAPEGPVSAGGVWEGALGGWTTGRLLRLSPLGGGAAVSRCAGGGGEPLLPALRDATREARRVLLPTLAALRARLAAVAARAAGAQAKRFPLPDEDAAAALSAFLEGRFRQPLAAHEERLRAAAERAELAGAGEEGERGLAPPPPPPPPRVAPQAAAPARPLDDALRAAADAAGRAARRSGKRE